VLIASRPQPSLQTDLTDFKGRWRPNNRAMCIIFLAINSHPAYSTIIASNRDEFLDRPTQSMSLWTEDDDTTVLRNNGHQNIPGGSSTKRPILAGKDVVAGGTWLGLDVSKMDVTSECKPTTSVADKAIEGRENSLRWIALTNFRDDQNEMHGKASRGSLLTQYLRMDTHENAQNLNCIDDNSSAESFAKNLCQIGQEYNGFSVLVADENGVYYCTNRGQYPPLQAAQGQESSCYGPLQSGIYGLSNGLLDSKWPKVDRGKEMLSKLCENTTMTPIELHESLMKMLSDEWRPTTDQYPHTKCCSIFVPEFDFYGKKYGTRSSTTILVEKNGGRISVLERTWLSGEDRWFELSPRANTQQ